MTATDRAPLDLDAIERAYAAWQEPSDVGDHRDLFADEIAAFLPALVAEVRRLRAERDDARIIADHIVWQNDHLYSPIDWDDLPAWRDCLGYQVIE